MPSKQQQTLMIYLLNASSAPNVKSSLVYWSKHRHDIGGFVCVNVLKKLTLRQFSSSTYAQLEVGTDHKGEIIEINNFVLAKSAFKTAKTWMLNDMQSDKLKYFFLDEVGNLEMDNLGHDELVRHIIKTDNKNQVFILLVREPLLDLVKEKYNFQNKKVIGLKQITG